MTGAMAGSTATTYRDLSDSLKVVTLTTNNSCNLRCPHCYLQYDGSHGRIDESTIDAVIASSASHVAIVGKEPLIDRMSSIITESLVSRCADVGKSVSVITNGLGLARLSTSTLRLLTWIDVSFDGGPRTYASYRRGDFERVIRNVQECRSRGARAINAMHTISTANLDHVDDMMSISTMMDWENILFSPYVAVRNDGSNATSTVPYGILVAALKASDAFCQNPSARLLLGAQSDAELIGDCKHLDLDLEGLGVAGKVLRINHDPLLLGYVRVTYDGYVLTPYESLHPASYKLLARRLQSYASLDAAFKQMRAA